MPQYPPLEKLPPMILTPDHLAEIEEALRQLAVVDHLLQKCERCKMPVEALRAECDGACEFFQALKEEYFGRNSPNPHAMA